MAKNNHSKRELEAKLDQLFFNQDFSSTGADGSDIEKYLSAAALYAAVENGISVLSDLKDRRSYIFYGQLGVTLGIAAHGETRVLDTIWEEEILSHVAEADLVQKQADELIFFSHVRKQERPNDHCMSSWLRMHDAAGEEHCVKHRIFYFTDGKSIRYALCLYNAASGFHKALVTDTRSGRDTMLSQIAGKESILSSREVEVLSMISRGMSSKEIAKALGISVFTVSRHRQNIIAAMNVKNSTEACKMASLLEIL